MENQEIFIIKVSYSLKLESGEIADSTPENEPLAFMTGSSQVLPAFENKLIDKNPGDAFRFSLSPDEAYGKYEPGLEVDLPKDHFQDIKEGFLQVGNTIPMMNEDGSPLLGVIIDIQDRVVKMDFNHPLAGQNLFFEGTVLEKRAASPAEAATGQIMDISG